VHGGGFCTYRERERFFSYRRVKQSGRMGAFIWIE
jgi:copper oxidase (laccase) domain-containing protein